MIHPTAIIGQSALVPDTCAIGPYSIIEDDVTLGAGCRIGPHVLVRSGSILGECVQVHAGTVIGGEPQDIGFDRSVPSGVRIGNHTVIREAVTVNRSSVEGGLTSVGARCFLMAASHVAHDCELGERVILANAVLLGGHVNIGQFAFIGGSAGIHQFCRIGESVMVGGNASISLDLPPYTMVADRNRLAGLNLVGLRRRGFSREAIADIKSCFSAIYRNRRNPREAALLAIENGVAKTPEGVCFLEFFGESKRGFARPGWIEE